MSPISVNASIIGGDLETVNGYLVDWREGQTMCSWRLWQPVILRRCYPSSSAMFFLEQINVYSDEWASYRCLAANGFPHGTVSHSVNFVDPVTGVHTQNIENTWEHAKRKLKRDNDTSKELFDSYLLEYTCIWRKKYDQGMAISSFVKHIAQVYKV